MQNWVGLEIFAVSWGESMEKQTVTGQARITGVSPSGIIYSKDTGQGLFPISEVIQELVPLKLMILVKKSVVLVKPPQKRFTKTMPWTENPGKIRRRAF